MKASYATSFGLCILLLGCTSEIKCPGFNSSAVGGESGGKGTINVAIDGSGSMKGFAVIGESAFQRVLEELDTTVGVSSALGYASSSTTVWRIGREAGQAKPRRDKSSLLAARRVDFFDEIPAKWPRVSSSIETFAGKDPDSVDILISDLEPDNASINQLLSAIKPKLEIESGVKGIFPWQRGKERANQLVIVGIRSQFDGGVFPAVQGNFKSFRYTGLRPFYVVAVGPTDKIEQIVSRLVKGRTMGEDIQISRFASNPNSGKTSFIDSTKTTLLPQNCVSPVFTLSQGLSGKLRVQNPSSRWVQALRSRRCTTQKINMSLFTSPIIGWGRNEIRGNEYFSASGTAVVNGTINQAGMGISTDITLLANTISFLDVSTDEASLDQVRWENWNTSGTAADGSKTQRLLALIRSIRTETDQYAQNRYGNRYSPARICAAIKG